MNLLTRQAYGSCRTTLKPYHQYQRKSSTMLPIKSSIMYDDRPYKQKSTPKLAAETLFYGALSQPIIQRTIPKLTQFILSHQPPILTTIMDITCSSMFLGGETLKQAKPLLDNLHNRNVKTIIDLANEGENTRPDTTFNAIIQLLEDASHYPQISGMALKISGLTSNDTLIHWHKHNETISKNKQALLAKLDAITQLAKNNNQTLYIDAEQYPIQLAINDICRSLMKKFNTNQTPVVYTTHQTYLKDSIKSLENDIVWAKDNGISFATKLVRGAYYEETFALSPNKPLVFETKPETDTSFNQAIKRCAEENIHCLVATHNSDSLKILENLKQTHSLETTETAQLLGMRDDLTFKTTAHSPRKYVPIGKPKNGAREYFGRRIIENSSALSGAPIEVSTRVVELTQRINDIFNINRQKA